MFGRYIDGYSIFVATLGVRPEGLETELSILLADGASVLRGRAIVHKVWTTCESPFRLPGMLLDIKALTPRSKALLDCMRAGPGSHPQVPGIDVVRPRCTSVTIPPLKPPTATLPWIPPPPTRPPPTQAASVADRHEPLGCKDDLHKPLGRKDPPAAQPREPPPAAVVRAPVDSTVITRRYQVAPPRLRASDVAVEEACGESFSGPTAVATPRPRRAPARASAAVVLPANPLATVTDDELTGFVETSAFAPLGPLERKRRVTRWSAVALAVTIAACVGMFRVRSAAETALAGEQAQALPIHLPAHATVELDGICYTVNVMMTPPTAAPRGDGRRSVRR